MRPISNVLTIDVEDWEVHKAFAAPEHRHQPLESRVQPNTEALLATLQQYGAQATLFFLGSVAERYPGLVRSAQALGHEIASHGYGHQLVYRQTPEEFRRDVKRSLDILQEITGQPVKGYRAPCWSINHHTPWAYEILVDLGLLYDASLFPFRTHLYGDHRAPVAPFVREVNGRRLYEIPASVLKIGRLRIPFGGGFYLRVTPYWMTRLATCLLNRQGRAAVFYLHPHEVDPRPPHLKLPWREHIIAYAHQATTLPKLRRLLSLGPTVGVNTYLRTVSLSPQHNDLPPAASGNYAAAHGSTTSRMGHAAEGKEHDLASRG